MRRISYYLQDIKLRASKQQLEMLWRPSASWGEAGQVFTQNYPSGNYGPPSGFNFDWGQLDPPIVVSVHACVLYVMCALLLAECVRPATECAKLPLQYQADRCGCACVLHVLGLAGCA
jgi:hypothetical protein